MALSVVSYSTLSTVLIVPFPFTKKLTVIPCCAYFFRSNLLKTNTDQIISSREIAPVAVLHCFHFTPPKMMDRILDDGLHDRFFI